MPRASPPPALRCWWRWRPGSRWWAWLLARPIVALLNPGLLGDAEAVAAGLRAVDRFPIAVAGVRIVFPMTALLVVAAWCLGVLNTPRPLLPVVLRAGAVERGGDRGAGVGRRLGAGGAGVDPANAGRRLVLAACVGALAGAALQLAVQMPFAVRLLGEFRPRLSLRDESVREAMARFGPALLGRGAVQLSGWLDLVLASFLTVGTLAALGWAQRVYLLPVALFGFSIAAVELPELARLAAGERAAATRRRFEAAFRRSVFVVAPTVVGVRGAGLSDGRAPVPQRQLRSGRQLDGVPGAGGLHARACRRRWCRACCRTSSSRPAIPARRRGSRSCGSRSRPRSEPPPASGSIGSRSRRWSRRPGAERLSLAAVGLALASAIGAWFELAVLERRVPKAEEAPALWWLWRVASGPLGAALVAAAAGGILWWVVRGLGPATQAVLVLPAYAAVYLGLRWQQLRAELGVG